MLPHTIRFNATVCADHYAELLHDLEIDTPIDDPGEQLAAWLEALLDQAGLARTLAALGITEPAIGQLATHAASQWTAGFNPRSVNVDDLAHLYEAAR